MWLVSVVLAVLVAFVVVGQRLFVVDDVVVGLAGQTLHGSKSWVVLSPDEAVLALLKV